MEERERKKKTKRKAESVACSICAPVQLSSSHCHSAHSVVHSEYFFVLSDNYCQLPAQSCLIVGWFWLVSSRVSSAVLVGSNYRAAAIAAERADKDHYAITPTRALRRRRRLLGAAETITKCDGERRSEERSKIWSTWCGVTLPVCLSEPACSKLWLRPAATTSTQQLHRHTHTV